MTMMPTNKHSQTTKHARLILATCVVAIIGAYVTLIASHADTVNTTADTSGGSLYISPTAAAYEVGQSSSFQIREDSELTDVNAVKVTLDYPDSLIKYVSLTLAGSGFDQKVTYHGASGQIYVDLKSNSKTLHGNQLIATVNISGIGAGSALITFVSGSEVLTTANNSNEVTTISGSTDTISNPPASTPPPKTPPTVTTPTKSVTTTHTSTPVTTTTTPVTTTATPGTITTTTPVATIPLGTTTDATSTSQKAEPSPRKLATKKTSAFKVIGLALMVVLLVALAIFGFLFMRRRKQATAYGDVDFAQTAPPPDMSQPAPIEVADPVSMTQTQQPIAQSSSQDEPVPLQQRSDALSSPITDQLQANIDRAFYPLQTPHIAAPRTDEPLDMFELAQEDPGSFGSRVSKYAVKTPAPVIPLKPELIDEAELPSVADEPPKPAVSEEPDDGSVSLHIPH